MALLKYEVANQDEIIKAIEAKCIALEDAQKKALTAGGEFLRRRMIDKAHTSFTSRTGKLVRSIKAKKLTAESVTVGVWTKDVEYAYYVEYGHAPPYRAPRNRAVGAEAKARVNEKRARFNAKHGSKSGGRTPPHPYITPAVAESMDEAKRLVEETMKREAGL